MEKEIVSTARDEATKITRVHYADGTFDALTDTEVVERGIATEVEEEVETTEEPNPSEEVSAQDTEGDEAVETVTVEDTEEGEVTTEEVNEEKQND